LKGEGVRDHARSALLGSDIYVLDVGSSAVAGRLMPRDR
jgi:hypothetical protein